MIESLLFFVVLLAGASLFGYAIYGIDAYLEGLSSTQKATLGLTGYISASWWFISGSLDKFAADNYVDMAGMVLSIVPAGSLGLTLAMGLGSILKHHFKRIDLLAAPVALLTIATMWGARLEVLNSNGLNHYGYFGELEKRARTGHQDSNLALQILLERNSEFEMKEPIADKYLFPSYFKPPNPRLRKYAHGYVANGNFDLTNETLFRPGDARQLDLERRTARLIISALAERTLNDKNPAHNHRLNWVEIITRANEYKNINSAARAAEHFIPSVTRANAIGRIWLEEVERARKSNPTLDQQISIVEKAISID